MGFALIGPLAAAIGVSTALYLCAAVELLAVSSLLTVTDIRTLTARTADDDSAAVPQAAPAR